MPDRIVTRESIAFDADAAAKAYAAVVLRVNSRAARPPNPWDEHAQPEHHAEWHTSFERSLTTYMTGGDSA